MIPQSGTPPYITYFHSTMATTNINNVSTTESAIVRPSSDANRGQNGDDKRRKQVNSNRDDDYQLDYEGNEVVRKPNQPRHPKSKKGAIPKQKSQWQPKSSSHERPKKGGPKSNKKSGPKSSEKALKDEAIRTAEERDGALDALKDAKLENAELEQLLEEAKQEASVPNQVTPVVDIVPAKAPILPESLPEDEILDMLRATPRKTWFVPKLVSTSARMTNYIAVAIQAVSRVVRDPFGMDDIARDAIVGGPKPPPEPYKPVFENPDELVEGETQYIYRYTREIGFPSWFTIASGGLELFVDCMFAGASAVATAGMYSLGSSLIHRTFPTITSDTIVEVLENESLGEVVVSSVSWVLQKYSKLFKCIAFANFAIGLLHVWQVPVRQVVEIQSVDIPLSVDQRPDSESLADLKHMNPQTVKAVYFEEDWFGLKVNKWRWTDLKNMTETPLTISLEIAKQLLTQSVCPLNSDEKTAWNRINQASRSLHTVNKDRAAPLRDEFISQETAFFVHFMFNREKDKMSPLPFPKPVET